MSEIDECRKGIPLPALSRDEEEGTPSSQRAETPFIHRFRTERNPYVYDVNTMDILRVDPVIWEILPDIGILRPEEIRAKHATRYGTAEIVSALEEIRQARTQKGLFLSQRPEVVFPLPIETIRERLSHHRALLTLNVTENCNFRCAYCVYSGQYTNRHKWSQRTMSWAIAKRAIDEYLAHRDPKRVAIGFYGGEPLLNLPLIAQCVQYVRGIFPPHEKVDFSATINGSLLHGAVADFLGREGFKLLISLDGPQEIHDRYRRFVTGAPTWKTVVENTKAFLTKYPRYQEGTILMFSSVFAPPVDARDVEKFFQTPGLFGNLVPRMVVGYVDPLQNTLTLDGAVTGIDAMYRKYLDNLVRGKINDGTLNDVEYCFERALFELPYVKFHKRYNRYGCSTHNRRRFHERFCSLSTCLCGGRRLYVSVDGTYWPCERVCESEYMKIGDVWSGVDARKVRQLLCDWTNLNNTECQYCWCLPTCQVGCWENVSDGSRPTTPLKKQACAFHRREMHELLIHYCSIQEENPHAFDFTKNIELS